MNSYIDYIEDTLQGIPDDGTLYRYKRQVLDQMSERAAEVTHAGLRDEKVLTDLIISEFPNLKDGFENFCAADRKEKHKKLVNKIMLFGTPALALLLLVLYLAVSFLTDAWSRTWLIFADGFLCWAVFLLGVGVARVTQMRRIFHPIARVLLALAVMCVDTAIFLLVLMFTGFLQAWVIFPAGVVGILLADAVYAHVTHQKLRIINYLVYIPIAAPMLYVVLGGLRVIPWDPGWIIILLGVAIDVILLIATMVNNSKYKYKPEVEQAWNEN